MPDTKITALTAIGANPIIPATFPIPMVDLTDTSMAASGTTKKVTVNQILGAGGTATLASATITGNLTVSTAANFNGGALAGYLNGSLLFGSSGNVVKLYGQSSGFQISNSAGTFPLLTINNSGDYTFQDGAGGTRMTLNATGLGVGVVPSAWVSYQKGIDFGGAGNYGSVSARANFAAFATNCYFDGTNWVYKNNNPANLYEHSAGLHIWRYAAAGTGNVTFTQAMTLDASGNLLVGVASSSNRLDIQKSTDCALLVKSTGANANIVIDYVSNYGNNTIRKSGTAVWDYGVINDSSATPAFKISNGSSAVGVQLVSGATAWTTLSDETIKDIIEPISNAVAKVGLLRSVIGKFKTDDFSKRRSFLIAQDVKSVLPEAVDVIGVNNELGLRYTEVIPLLVAAIKELTARVQTLEAR